MINYIVGGLIIGLAIYLIIRGLRKTLKGEGCSCDGCSACGNKCDYNIKKGD